MARCSVAAGSMESSAHAAGQSDIVGTVVISEAPGADERACSLRQSAAHGHGARAPKRHLTRGEDPDPLLGEDHACARQLGGCVSMLLTGCFLFW
jgi:hypothetical protein